MRALFLSLLFVVPACSVSIPDGRLRCDAVTACPPGYACVRALCFAPGTDAGPELVDVPSDVPTDVPSDVPSDVANDAGTPDGGVDGGMPERWEDIATGSAHSCALTDRGRVFCWGDDRRGAVGNDGAAQMFPFTAPTEVAGFPADVTLEAIGAGEDFSCAMDRGVAVYCWGSNTNGRLGDPDVSDLAALPNRVELGTVLPDALTVGGRHACVLDAGGMPHCWGLNNTSQLGVASTGFLDGRATPVAPTIGPFISLSAGEEHTCGLPVSGAPQCWGSNNVRQLGTDAALPGMQSADPISLTTITGAVSALVAMGSHSCALTDSVHCWGANAAGQLHLLHPPDQVSPPTEVTLSFTPVLYAGNDAFLQGHTCATSDEGALYCWGSNFYGQLGNGTMTASDSAIEVPSLTSVDALSAGPNHTCAVADGVAYCWGRNDDGQLGVGDETVRLAPAMLPPP
jgi:alpha-tubulin suppressor-like RCC1 family protein